MIHSDTDGLLDRCAECGARAGFATNGLRWFKHFRAGCTDCCEQTGWFKEKYDAVIAWNLEQRAKRSSKV